jgi:Ca2+-binding RTX toxin-like protein
LDDIESGRAPAAWLLRLPAPAARAPGGAGPRSASPAAQRSGTSDDDWLLGTDGDDTLTGLAGDDDLQGLLGDDRLDGGLGWDTAHYDDARTGVMVNLSSNSATGGSGQDTLVSIESVSGSDHDDWLTGDGEDNELLGGAGNDQLTGLYGDDMLDGGGGDDELDGGAGLDIASYATLTSGVVVDLPAGRVSGAGGTDHLDSIEGAVGSLGDDRFIGDDDDNLFFGSLGDDEIEGGAGMDFAVLGVSRLADARIRHDPITGAIRVETDFEGTDLLYHVEYLAFGGGLVIPTTSFLPEAFPTVLEFSPAQGSADARVGADIVLVFNAPVQRGTGTIVLRDAAGVAIPFDVATSPDLHFDGTSLRIDPPAALKRATSYTLEMPAGAVIDLEGQTNSPLPAYRFTTRRDIEVSVAERSVVEEGAASGAIEVRLSEPSTNPVKVTLQLLTDSTASAGDDVRTLTKRVEFAPGEVVAHVGIEVIDDQRFEPTETFTVELSEASGAVLGEATGRVLIIDNDATLAGLPTDELFSEQWHLYPGTGANVLPVWPEYTGAGVRVGVFDQGIDAKHPDLAGRVDETLGRRTSDLQLGGQPLTAWDNHGTTVAGVVAAARNGEGSVGVAYEASLVSLYSSFGPGSTLAEIEHAFTQALTVDVLNDSWGFAPQYYFDEAWAFYDNFADPAFAASGAALKRLATEGRGGLGTVIVQSAGNSFEYGDDTNLHSFQNSRYIVTVGATDYAGAATYYSSPGASILVAAPGGAGAGEGGDILTTDRAGRLGYESGDHVRIAGTSFSAPVVSGVVALMLQANPQLGYRDVQTLLAMSATRGPEPDGNLWRDNGAHTWNGGGLRFDSATHDLGFGRVDALAAVRLAESWGRTPATAANAVELRVASAAPAQAIPDGTGSLRQSVEVTQALEVERAEVTVDIAHSRLGDLSLMLTSPSGTESWILSRPGRNALSPYGADQANISFTFSTVLSLGESSRGTWSLTVYDEAAEDSGTLRSWSLNLVGRAASGDDTYVYTNEFGVLAGPSSARAALADTGGADTLNAAAVSTDSVIDLAPGGTSSRIAGQPVGLAEGTVIERAFGGDGHDRLGGNSAANELHGMRGDDVLQGRGGNDLLDGGAGIDTVRASGVRSAYQLKQAASGWTLTGGGAAAGEGIDTLVSIERVQFDDRSVALDVGVDGHAAQAAQILRALFGAHGLSNPGYAGIGLALLDGGMPYADLVALALSTSAFQAAAGSSSAEDFVRLVYRNVVGTAPDASALSTYAGLLHDGTMTQAQLAVLACQSDINTGSAALVGVQESGLVYLPFTG